MYYVYMYIYYTAKIMISSDVTISNMWLDNMCDMQRKVPKACFATCC